MIHHHLTKKQKIIGIFISLVIIGIGGIVFSTHRPANGLDGFIELTKNDPLFYSPFFDATAFASAVENLEKSEQVLKKTALGNLATISAAYGPEYAQLIRNHPLFPTDFLKLLPSVSQATEEFLENPTARNARKLLARYDDASQAYEKNALSMKQAFDVIDARVPDDYPLMYFFTDSATSLDIAKYDFDLIYKNSLTLKQDIEERRLCLSGEAPCPVVAQKTIDTQVIAQTQPVTKPTKNTDFIFKNLPLANADRTIAGPYTISSSCWDSSDGNHDLYAIYSKKNGVTSVLPKLADQNYYRMVPKNAMDKIGKAVIDKGLSFYNQPEATTYECTDLTFYPELLTLDYLNSNKDLSPSQQTHLWNNQFGLLAPALQSLADFTNLLETSQRASHDFVLSPQFLFITRSAYSLTYLPFADSVWRIEENPKYLITRENYDRMNAPKAFQTLTQLKQAGFSDDAIMKAHINQRDLIESLLTKKSQ